MTPGAFVWLPQVGEVPARAIRFAIADPERRIVSGAWTAAVDRSGRFRLLGAGPFGLVAIIIGRDGLGFRHAGDGGEAIIGRGIAAPGPRGLRTVPASTALPWHALSLAFPMEYLRRSPQPVRHAQRRPMILLPSPERGRTVRIAFLLTDSASGRIDYEDRSDLYLGRLTDGRGLNLLVMRRVVDSDLGALSNRLVRLSPAAPLRLFSRSNAPTDEERGLLLFTPGADHLDIAELHNLHRPQPATEPATPMGQLAFRFDDGPQGRS